MATEFGVYVHNKLTGEGGFYDGLDENLTLRPTFAISAWGEEIWFGTDWGVYGFNAVTNEWLDSSAKEYKTDAGINVIHATRQATWVGTNDGVLKYDRRMARWTHFTTMDGLADNRVYSIEMDDDYILFGTARGLTRFYWNNPFRND
jgi:ligand-binding sensor domain-containing protein